MTPNDINKNKLESGDQCNEKFCVAGELSELSRIRDFVEFRAKDFGFNEEDAYKISLAVDEACTNLIRYAYHLDASRKICINIETSSEQFVVNILDEGSPFNPLEIQPPEMGKYFKEFRRGGLGIHLMRSVMDKIEYYPSETKGSPNVLKLFKSISGLNSPKMKFSAV